MIAVIEENFMLMLTVVAMEAKICVVSFEFDLKSNL